MKYLIILLFGITTQAQIDEEFSIYVFSFESYTGYDVDTKIEFGSFIGSDKGTTAVSIKGKNHIIVNKDQWEKLSYYQKYWVIYHEIGHAKLNLGHTKKGIMIKSIPDINESLMHKFLKYRIELKKINKNQ